ncbi:hypothetical protein OG756_06445 [Streptomyces sp. NBC_01310]|nr:hypothetical protein OG756_06445 [Streptomyces sp. NBC_01310]
MEPPTGRARSELHHQAVAEPGGEPELVVEYRDGEFVVCTPEIRPHSS